MRVFIQYFLEIFLFEMAIVSSEPHWEREDGQGSSPDEYRMGSSTE
jgi:hypothetical protein